MDVEPAGGASLIQKLKPQLIEALCGDPDFLLQHCHSSSLLTQKEYDHVKASPLPWDKTRDILDYVMSKDGKHIQKFLSLLKTNEIQETFPKLGFLKKLPRNTLRNKGKKRKKSEEMQQEEDVSRNQLSKVKTCSGTVTEKQLMLVARSIGKNWKEVGTVALEIPSVRLEQIVEDNPNSHRDRVFSMLRLWSMREKKASATYLHSLLTQEEIGVTPGNIDFLLEES